MDVIALVGPSGTGKSHHALIVAHKHKADAIIDDGILIKDGKIVGGHSAKKEQSKIMAVRFLSCRDMPKRCRRLSKRPNLIAF